MNTDSSSKSHTFFDINKLPLDEGLLIFPISMSRISNSQNAQHCWDYMKIFSPKKITRPTVGMHFIYGDYLYFNSNTPASTLKHRFTPLVSSHKYAFLNLLSRHPFYISQAFSFETWNQTLLNCKDFTNLFGHLKKRYAQDTIFQNYLQKDLQNLKKTELDEHQLHFFLEENLLFYLLVKGKVRIWNDYIRGHHKWLLWCYPGYPLYSQIYMFQQNFFGFQHDQNVYQNSFYNLEKRKLYNFENIDLNAITLM